MPDIEKLFSQDKIKEITDKLETGIMDLINEDNFRKYLDTMTRSLL
ncbi:MAG: hypothetical protein Q4F95_09310 [Oscillospiraceae bacterium]|nr:hypothetical protein [Oscillospiraceae bacterium]